MDSPPYAPHFMADGEMDPKDPNENGTTEQPIEPPIEPAIEPTVNPEVVETEREKAQRAWRIKKPYVEPKKLTTRAFPRKRKAPRINDLYLEKQIKTVQDIYHVIQENKKATIEEVAEKIGKSPYTVRAHLYNNEFLRAYRNEGAIRVKFMTPLAVAALQESLTAKSEDVKFKAASKFLESEGIFGPTKVEIHHNNLAEKTNEELLKIHAAIPIAPMQTIMDAEVVS